jgi:amidase
MEILQKRVGLIRTWEQFLNEYSIVLCPISAKLPFNDQSDVESAESFRQILEAQMTQIGLPLLSVPAMNVATSSTANRPLGVQLVAGRFREDILFEAAAAIEARSETVDIAEPD